MATRGKEVRLEPGTDIPVRLAAPLATISSRACSVNAERAQLARRADVLLPRQAVEDQVHATSGRQVGHPISVGFGLGDEALGPRISNAP